MTAQDFLCKAHGTLGGSEPLFLKAPVPAKLLRF